MRALLRHGLGRTSLLFSTTALAGALAFGCNDLSNTLTGQTPEQAKREEERALATAEQAVVAGSPMVRNLSNREYLSAVSDLIGEDLPLSLQAGWTATTQFSGFDAVPWTNLDAKAVRDRADTLELLLDKAVASPKVMTCTASGAEELAYATCAKGIVEAFATRGFGRPLLAPEVELLAKRYEDALALAKSALTDPKEIFADAVRAVIGSVLLAPQFMNRIESAPGSDPEFAGERELDAYELANRLSFMFTGSIPDDELWSKAKDGSLASDPDELVAQATRLLDTKADTFVKSFLGQWFDFRAYESAKPDTLEARMYEESWRTFTDIVKEGSPVTAILEPGFAYVNADLAKHYSLVGDFPAELTRVPTVERGGALQQGSWLSLSATPLKTSAIHRGRLVQDRILCKAIPPPDSALFEKIQQVSASIPADATVKQRLEQHRNAGDACFGCHQYMDPIGLGLEGFDMHGRLRNAYADTGKPVELESTLLGTPFTSFLQLNAMLADLPDYHACAAEKLSVYSLRRIVDHRLETDAALLAYLAHPQDGKPPSVREMVIRLVRSKAFRKVNHGVRS